MSDGLYQIKDSSGTKFGGGKRKISLLRSSTIRFRLHIAFILMVLLAALAISSVTVVMGTQDGRQRKIDQLESVITLKQAEIKSWVRSLNVNLGIVISDEDALIDIRTLTQNSSDTEVYKTAYDRLRTRFKHLSESMGLFDELFIMDVQGRVFLSTNTAHENEKHSIYDYFTEGMKGPYIQQPSYSLSLGEMTIVASSPVNVNGKLIGVLAGRASLKSLNDIMIERTGLGDTGETYLVGTNHRLLTELRDEGYAIPVTYIRTLGSEASLDGYANGSATYQNYSGKTVIGVYRWLPDLRVALMAEQEQGEALQGTVQAMIIIVGVALVAVFGAIIAAMFLTRSIVRPLSELSAASAQIAEGDLDRIARVESEDEIGIVARAFNSMTARLRNVVRNLERRTVQLKAVNEVGRQISPLLHVSELMANVANSLQKTFNYHNVGILLLDTATGNPVLKSNAGPYAGVAANGKINMEKRPVIAEVARTGKPLLINDIYDSGQGRFEQPGQAQAEMAVPIKIGEKILGVLDIEEDHVGAFDEQDLFTAQTLADQLAIAIENAHLYDQARQLATMEERQRLARDLHDAVSQTLFSASLIAEVIPRLWERNPEEGKKRLEEIRQLTRGALAEMRTLLLELRPATLVDAEMSELLRQLAESVTGRARIPVTVNVDGHCSPSPELKIAMYRIAQEALNNVAKHSRATQAEVSLQCQPDKIQLIVRDNGKGFSLDARSPTSLGLGIMQERAKSIGASLSIESVPHQGTSVMVVWQIKREGSING